jgi:hypothetical protein
LDGDGRRSIYIQVSRNFLAPMMLAFDMPIPFSTMGRRSNSNVPAQSLIMMNHPLVRQQSERWARALLAAEASTEQRIVKAFETAFARPPSELQVNRARDFVEQQAALYESDEQDVRVWRDLCHTLVNMKDFIYLR